MVTAFSSLARTGGGGVGLTIHCPPSPFFLSFFLLPKVEISSRTRIPLFRAGSVHSGSAS